MEQGRKRRRKEAYRHKSSKVEATGKKAVFTAVLAAGVLAAGIVAAGPWVASAYAANTVTIMKPVYYEKSTSGLTLLDQSPATDDNGVIKLDVTQHMAVVTSGLTVNLSNPTIASAALIGTVLTLTPLAAGTTEVTISGMGAGGVVYSDKIQLQLVKIGDSTGDGLITSADALYIYKIVNGQVQISDAEKNLLDIDRDGAVTSKDASLLMSTYVGKPGSASETKVIVNLSEVNDSPFVYGVAAPTTAVSGQTVTGIYHYVDMEGDVEASEYQWYVGSQVDGTDREPISGATRLTYTVRQQDESKYLFFGVRPVAAAGRNDTQMVISSAGVQVPDTTAPTLTSSTPANQATVASKTDPVVLTFSESMKAAASKHVRVKRVADDVAVIDYLTTDTAHVTIQDKTVTIANPGIADTEGYYVEVETGAFTDLSNNAYAGITSKTALTFSIPDITAPTVTTLSPVNGVTIQQLHPTMILTFNENVQAAAGKAITVRRAADDTAEATYQADDTAHVTINGGQVSIQDASLNLVEQTGYYVEIDSGAFTDAALNPAPAITGRTAWSFITADLTAPTLTSSTPANQATVASKTDPVVLTFSESMKAAASKHVRVKRVADDVAVIDYLTTDTAHVTIQDKTVTIANPGIADTEGYYVEVETGAFTDLSNNAYAGITSKTALTFSIPDITAPTVTTLSPQNGSSTMNSAAELTLTFSEPVQAVTGKTVAFYKTSDDAIPVATYQADDATKVVISGGGKTVTLANPGLDPLQSYYVTVEGGAFLDSANLPFAGLTSKTAWAFTTISNLSATAVPDVPIDELNLSTGATLTVTINGDTFKDSLSDTDFTLNNAPPGTIIALAGKYSDTTAFILLDFDKTYFAADYSNITVTVKGSGLTGGFNIESSEFAIQAVQAMTAPMLAPASGSTVNSLQAPFSMTFSSNVTAVAGKMIKLYRASDNSLVETIQADDSTKVKITGNTVTIWHQALTASTPYYMTVDAWAFENAQSVPSPAISGSATWRVTTGALSTVGYISDFVIGTNGRSAIQVYSNDNGMAGMQSGYELFFYRYVQANHTVQTFSLPFLPYYPGMPYIILNSNFYDFFDITKAAYFNEEAYFDLAGYTLNAIVLKKDGVVVDVVGDPNATTEKPILPNGGTLVRRQGTMAGSTVYNVYEWTAYEKDTFQYLGSHQP